MKAEEVRRLAERVAVDWDSDSRRLAQWVLRLLAASGNADPTSESVELVLQADAVPSKADNQD